MKKKHYIYPLIEVEKINLKGSFLMASPDVPVPPHPGAPARDVSTHTPDVF